MAPLVSGEHRVSALPEGSERRGAVPVARDGEAGGELIGREARVTGPRQPRRCAIALRSEVVAEDLGVRGTVPRIWLRRAVRAGREHREGSRGRDVLARIVTLVHRNPERELQSATGPEGEPACRPAGRRRDVVVARGGIVLRYVEL